MPNRKKRRMTMDGRRGYYTALGYRAASLAAAEARSPVGASGRRHLSYDRKKLVNQSREFMRDNGIYKGMIRRAVSYVVAGGFKLSAASGDKYFDDRSENLWREFWQNPDVRGLISGRKIEKTVCSELMVCGDTAVIKVKGGKIQLIESEQISARSNSSGIWFGKLGNVTSIAVSPYNNYGRVDDARYKKYKPEKEIYFLTDPERPSATRSAPPCEAAFPMLHRINDVCDSEAIAWQMLSKFAVAVNQESAADMGYDASMEDDTKSGSDLEGDAATRITEIDEGMIFWGEKGEKVSGIERSIPGRDFPESIRMFLRLLGLPIGMPLEIVLLDWTDSNYSQSRAVLEQAYQTFRDWQDTLIDYFLRKVYIWKVDQWIREGKLANIKGKYGHSWIVPTFPWIDQLKEAQAYGHRIDRGLTTHAAVLKSLNLDRDEVVAARDKEIRDAIARAKAIEAETGEFVDWRIFAGMKPEKREAGRPDGNPATPITEKADPDDS